MYFIQRKWLWATLSAAALMAAGPGLAMATGPGGGHGGGGGGGHGGGSGGGGRGASSGGFSSGGRGFSSSMPSSATHSVAPSSFGRTGTVGPVHPGNTGTIGNSNSARSLNTAHTVNTRTLQPGQIHNGMPVHSVTHWSQNGTWNNNHWNNNWNNNWNHRHNFFFVGLPFFWGWPFPFWGWDWYPWWNTPRSYYADSWVAPPAYAAAPEQPVPQVTTAQLEVFLPDPNAQLQIDGNRTTSTGTVRYYESPPITPGKEYQYTVTATWNKDGKPVTGELKVGIQAGKVTVLDFTSQQPPPQQPPPGPNPQS